MARIAGAKKTPMPIGEFEIADWRRRVFDLYATVRATAKPSAAHEVWRTGRESLFRTHPQSPIRRNCDRANLTFRCFPYDPHARRSVDLKAIRGAAIAEVAIGDDGSLRMRPFAKTVGLADWWGNELTLFWIEGYGGGIFLPFADATNGTDTYGGGRYLLDTIKGADLGAYEGRLVLDFNFAYQPSCAYAPLWVCPLAPPENRLAASVRAGEKFA